MSKPQTEIAIFRSGNFAPVKDASQRTLPSRLLVMPWDSINTPQGKVVCNENTFACLMANQKAVKFDRVALDFQHNSVPGFETYKGEPAKVAAFGVPSVEFGKGIFLNDLEWTDEGKEHALGGHYPDLSPAVKRNDRGEIVLLHSVALARQGEVDGLTLFSAEIDLSPMKDLSNLDPGAVRASSNIFLAALGLATIADDAAPDAMLTAINGGVQKITALTKAPANPGNGGKQGAENNENKDGIATLSARFDAMERRQLVERASAAGKVIPLTDEQMAALPLTTLSAMIEKLPVTVSLQSKTGELATLAANSKSSAEDAEVMKRMGISEADWKKHNA